MAENYFLRPLDFYQRDINPLKNYVIQNGFYLHKMTGKDRRVCEDYIRTKMKDKSFKGMTDPTVKYYERADNGDRDFAYTKLSSYIGTVIANREILAPTGTAYLPPDIAQSPLVDFIDEEKAKRKVFKKEAFQAESRGQMMLFLSKNNAQTTTKLKINSVSGAMVTESCCLHNPTGHSTLTSITRSESAIGNANNEKVIAGNRHYFTADVILYNLISITSNFDRAILTKVIRDFDLVYPSCQDVMDCIRYSSDFYFRDIEQFKPIEDFIEKLDPVERAAFVYVGDMFHIRKHNDAFVRKFLGELSYKVTDKTYNEPLELLKKIDEAIVNYAHLICLGELRGKGKDYHLMEEHVVQSLVATCKNIEQVIYKYREFIEAIFLTPNVPASTANVPSMIRRVVPLSDTDSTMFTVYEYIVWYFGDLLFHAEAIALGASMMFIATQSIAHSLAIMSANMGVRREKIFDMAMKPEFFFIVFAQTPVSKHYYSTIWVKEGNVYDKPKMEIKGVHLKNSALPKPILYQAHAVMKQVTEDLVAGKKISIINHIQYLTAVEDKIISEVDKSNVNYFKRQKIKSASAYTKGELETKYQAHLLWKEVFEPKYGAVEEPTYTAISIPTTIKSKTSMKQWIADMEDRELADRLTNWMAARNKEVIKTFYISQAHILAYGIPKELLSIVNKKRIVLDLTNANRMILGSLGYFPKTGWLMRNHNYGPGNHQISI